MQHQGLDGYALTFFSCALRFLHVLLNLVGLLGTNTALHCAFLCRCAC